MRKTFDDLSLAIDKMKAQGFVEHWPPAPYKWYYRNPILGVTVIVDWNYGLVTFE